MKTKTPDKDYYALLEVNPRARPQVVTAAYRALMKIVHPDADKARSGINSGNIAEAYEVLSDATKRRSYDESREIGTGKMIGPYKLLEQIAEGGFGRTYKAEHTILKELVCIKDCSRISIEDTALLIEEAKTTWDLRHYAIPAIRDLIRLEDGRVVLVMSYIPGLTLQKVVEKSGRLDPEHVAWIAERVLFALNYTHRHGVIHGDIKPHNIIIQPEKHMAVLVDFGLALVKPSSKSVSKGHTPLFAPPEQMNGSTLLPESDFYSLGMTMIYALGGGFEYVERKEVPRDTPVQLSEFIRRLIVKSVTSRPRWETEDLCDTFRQVREEAFGRRRSGMKPIPGVS